MWKRLTASVLLMGLLVACGDDDDASGGEGSTSASEATSTPVESEESETVGSTTELRPAEDARAEEALAGEQVAMGDTADVNGLAITVSNPVVGGDELGPWLTVNVRVENGTDAASSVPYLEIHCSGNDEGGGWQADSTLELGAGLPAGTFDEGTVNLLVPGDGRFGEQRPPCVMPAAIAVVGSDVRYSLDQATVDSLNEGAGVADPVTTSAPAPPTTAPPTVDLGDSDVDDVVAELVEAGLCSNPRVPPEDSDELDLGIEPPSEEVECDTPDGLTANVSQFASDDALRGLAVVAISLYEAFGIDPAGASVITPGNGVIVGADSNDGSNDPTASAAWIEQAADVLNEDVVSMTELAGR